MEHSKYQMNSVLKYWNPGTWVPKHILNVFYLHIFYVRRPKPYLYKIDHKYQRANGTDPPIVILYAEIGTKKFTTFHKVLAEKAEEGKLIYVLRHFVAVSTLNFPF